MTSEELSKDYKLIPLNEITEEARLIAVMWAESPKSDFIADKHKLASDIMNYAIRYHKQQQILPK